MVEERIFAVLDGVDKAMSTYREDSELERFNRHRSAVPFALSRQTLEVLQLASQVYEASGGAFDPTVGSLVELWGFGPSPRGDSVPTQAEIEQRLAHTGLSLVTASLEDGQAAKIDPRVEIDLSAIAKGYAVDCTGAEIEDLGYDSFMIELGGEVRTGGSNLDGRAWRIAIERPLRGRAIQHIVQLSDRSLATSGDYRNYYEIDAVRYSHAIDPATGRPVLHPPASASVVHSSCALADAWATAMMVLGVERGLEIAQQLDLAVLFVVHAGDQLIEHSSPAFDRLEE